MKRSYIISLLFLIISHVTFAQDTEKIIAEGTLLYRLERASWFGTDDFIEKFSGKRDSLVGYLSYESNNNQVVNIFYKGTDPYQIMVRYTFDYLPKNTPLYIDTLNRSATESETALITIRQDAISRISENSDNFFSFHKNTSLNLIPLIDNNTKRVFAITAPKVPGYVIIGNDYLLIYEENNEFITKERIHNSMLQFPYTADSSQQQLESTYHSHTQSEFITSTDICTLMLYKDFVEWRQHYVISNKYVSIFDLDKEALIILTRKAFEKINKNIGKK